MTTNKQRLTFECIIEFDEDDDGTIDIIAYDFNQDGEWDKFKEVG